MDWSPDAVHPVDGSLAGLHRTQPSHPSGSGYRTLLISSARSVAAEPLHVSCYPIDLRANSATLERCSDNFQTAVRDAHED